MLYSYCSAPTLTTNKVPWGLFEGGTHLQKWVSRWGLIRVWGGRIRMWGAYSRICGMYIKHSYCTFMSVLPLVYSMGLCLVRIPISLQSSLLFSLASRFPFLLFSPYFLYPPFCPHTPIPILYLSGFWLLRITSAGSGPLLDALTYICVLHAQVPQAAQASGCRQKFIWKL